MSYAVSVSPGSRSVSFKPKLFKDSSNQLFIRMGAGPLQRFDAAAGTVIPRVRISKKDRIRARRAAEKERSL